MSLDRTATSSTALTFSARMMMRPKSAPYDCSMTRTWSYGSAIAGSRNLEGDTWLLLPLDLPLPKLGGRVQSRPR